MDWKEYPDQEKFTMEEHEKLGWRKITVKKSIFNAGLKRRMWGEDELWEVCYKIDSLYKTHIFTKHTS
jgi:hypothetical protein